MPYLVAVFLLLFCTTANAIENFLQNPLALYPPGCATVPDAQLEIYGNNWNIFHTREIELLNVLDLPNSQAVELSVARVGCSEPNRSIIWLIFRIPEWVDPEWTIYQTPVVYARINGQDILMRLAAEANQFGSITYPDGSGQLFGGPVEFGGGHDRIWVYILENLSILSPVFDEDVFMLPSQYNDSFTLVLTDGLNTHNVMVPANNTSQNPRQPFNGRHSGIWVVNGAADQGVLISISENPHEALQMVMFFSWYTYGPGGELLWLTANGFFDIGDTEITMPIQHVTDGVFLGSKTAARVSIGDLTLVGYGCDDLQMFFDLRQLSLGRSNVRLQRVAGLETAGYTCRDFEQRLTE